MIDLNKLYTNDQELIEINNTYELPKELIIDERIKKLSPLKVEGEITLLKDEDLEDKVYINCTINGTMYIEDSITLDIVPYEFNNKIHDETQINRIANSIKEFWFTQPIVIDKNNVVIIGHWRLESAKKLWLEKVPCVILDELSDKQIQKLRILDNKLNESEYDLANLKMELDSLWEFNP